MKIELLKSQRVPCTGFTAFAGMRFEVEAVSRFRGVWIQHMGRSMHLEPGDYREVDSGAVFVARRACVVGGRVTA